VTDNAPLASFIAQETLEAIPFAVTVYDTTETLVALNKRAELIFGVARAEIVGRLQLSQFEGNETMASAVAAVRRALQGETVTLPVFPVEMGKIDTLGRADTEVVWLDAVYFPIRDPEGRVRFVMLVNNDQTALVKERQAVEGARTELRAQQETIQTLSLPIIEVWQGILAVPMIGSVDAARASDMTERLLGAVSGSRVRYVILDLMGLTHMDAMTAEHIVKIVRAVELLGTRAILVGIQSAISMILVELDVGVGSLRTSRTLGDALARCIGRTDTRIA
jgi:rsbT co-antagonist protein RsbR